MIAQRIALLGLLCVTSLTLAHAAPCPDQIQDRDDPGQPKPKVLVPAGSGASVQAINDDYTRQLLQLERQRLSRLARLAAGQPPKEASETYEQLFRLAIANNLFADVEEAADQVLKSPQTAPPVVQFLARMIDVVAAADRGAYDESLASLRSLAVAVSARQRLGEPASTALDSSAVLAICEAYYGRLIQADQFEVARNALRVVLSDTDNAAVKRFCTSKLYQLDMIGKPAPAIEGTDLDGKQVGLGEQKGNPVLVVFWASWCLPSSGEVAWLDQVYSAYMGRGFRILGINVDTLQSDSPKLETLVPNIRRFVLDHNLRWPNLINGAGAADYAKAYGVHEIPSNILIGRDGNVLHVDLTARNADSVISRAVGR